MQSDMDGFPDDEVVGLQRLRRNNIPGSREVPRVVDTTAETLGIQFERFLEG
jgi:DNA replication licensing factor MCM6